MALGLYADKVYLLSAVPFVRKFESKSKNLVQGDPLKVDCKVFSEPAPTITWYKDENKLDTSGECACANTHTPSRGTRTRTNWTRQVSAHVQTYRQTQTDTNHEQLAPSHRYSTAHRQNTPLARPF